MKNGNAVKGKSRRLVGLFAAALITLSATGCSNDLDDIELCQDNNNDFLCDDDGSPYHRDSYLVIDGKKVGYVKYGDEYKTGLGGSSSGSFGG